MIGSGAPMAAASVCAPSLSLRPDQFARPRFDMRGAARALVSTSVQLRTGTGLRDGGRLFDLSCGGCRIVADTLFLDPGQRLVVRPDGLEGLAGVVQWVAGQCAGVEFIVPLYLPVFENVVRRHGALGH